MQVGWAYCFEIFGSAVHSFNTNEEVVYYISNVVIECQIDNLIGQAKLFFNNTLLRHGPLQAYFREIFCHDLGISAFI